MLVSLVNKKILEDLEVMDTTKSNINSQAFTEKPGNRQINGLKRDVELLKEMLRNEKLKNQELQVQLDRARLTNEIESPSYKLAKLRF